MAQIKNIKLHIVTDIKQSKEEEVCECGHMMGEAVNLLNRNARKRKAPYRPNSISSEWIGLPENATFRVTSKKPRTMSLLNNGQTKIVRRNNRKTKSNITNSKIKALNDAQNSNNNDNLNNINNNINNNDDNNNNNVSNTDNNNDNSNSNDSNNNDNNNNNNN